VKSPSANCCNVLILKTVPTHPSRRCSYETKSRVAPVCPFAPQNFRDQQNDSSVAHWHLLRALYETHRVRQCSGYTLRSYTLDIIAGQIHLARRRAFVGLECCEVRGRRAKAFSFAPCFAPIIISGLS
jgi:hypothetical protein